MPGGSWRSAAVALPPGTTASAAARALHLAGVPLLTRGAGGARGRARRRSATPAPLPYCPFPPPPLCAAMPRAAGGVDRPTARRLRGLGAA